MAGGSRGGVSWASCSGEEILGAAFLADATGRSFWREQPPSVLLRTGAYHRTTGQGSTTGATDHVRDLLLKPQGRRVELSRSAVDLSRAFGLIEKLVELGCMLPDLGGVS